LQKERFEMWGELEKFKYLHLIKYKNMDEIHQFSSRVATSFLIGWLLVMLAGADWPPPVGFLWFVVMALGCAVAVYKRVPVYLHWLQCQLRWRWLRCLRDGLVMGFAMATIAWLGTASWAQGPWESHVIWFAVVSVVGVFNALAVNGVAMLFGPQL
jgi:hypothetical protein